MADVGLHGLFREEEALSDLTVDEPIRNELKNLDLPRRGILADLAGRRRRERDHGPVATGTTTRGGRLEAAAVVAIPVQDLLALSGVHASPIGVAGVTL